MRQVFSLLIVAVAALGAAGCASYAPSSAPVPQLDSMQARVTGAGIAVGADPWTGQERQQATFDANFDDAGVVAVLVVVENTTDRPVLVRPDEMVLRLPNDRGLAPANVTSVVYKVGENGSVVGATIAFGLVGALVAGDAEQTARASRTSDYNEKAFRVTRLSRGEKAQGFVFFIPPVGTAAFDEGTLTVKVRGIDDDESQPLDLPLSRLAFSGAEQKTTGVQYPD